MQHIAGIASLFTHFSACFLSCHPLCAGGEASTAAAAAAEAAVSVDDPSIPFDLFERDARLFRNRQVALNTVYLWGQGVRQVALTHATALAVSNEGMAYTWGGTNKWWTTADGPAGFDALAMDTNKARRHVHCDVVACCVCAFVSCVCIFVCKWVGIINANALV